MKYLGWWGTLFITVIFPIGLWLLEKPLSQIFSNTSSYWTSMGQVLGLVGMSLLSISFIFNTRLKFISNLFGGLDKLYFAHHLVGGLSLTLLLFHPLTLAAKYFSISIKSAALFLLPGSDWVINLGIFALLILILLLVFTMFIKLPYHIWKFTHKFLGLVLLLSILHTVLSNSDVSFNLPLKYYMLTLMGAASLAYLYKTIFYSYFIKQTHFIVSEINKLNSTVWEIILIPQKNPLIFIPGQFVFIKFINGKIKEESHPFSITSIPSERELKLVIKNLGDFTSTLDNLQKGAEAVIEGPYGNFGFNIGSEKEQIWIAGGIGITPFLSLARNNNFSNKVRLFYSVKTPEEAVFLNELQQISSKNHLFEVNLWISQNSGLLTAEQIVGPKINSEIEVFVCGPMVMEKSLRKQFKNKGLKNNQIHSEDFNLR